MRTVAIPAMVDAHSHAFQIDLRGTAERPAGPADDFWSWREAMYRLAGTLDPDRMYALARRAYAEMALAGYGAVGEFHYVHHRPDGTAYDEPNAMAIAVARAARAEGIDVVLLPAAYHRAGFRDGVEVPPAGAQRRFCDESVEAFLARVDALRAWARSEGVAVGVAAHSVRAVPAAWLESIARYADAHGLVRHVHAAEQQREIEECRAEHGCTPVELLARTGFLGERTSVVHAIHVDERDIALLAASRTIVVSCPTTEGSLGDGIFPAMAHQRAGVRIAIGSDSQVVIDPFEEARELETLARRSGGDRRALLAATGDLWQALRENGAASLGMNGTPSITIDLDNSRLRGVDRADLPAALVTCSGRDVVVPSGPRGAAG